MSCLFINAEDFGENFVCVLAECRWCITILHRRCRKFDRVGNQPAQLATGKRVAGFNNHVPRLDLRVLKHLIDGVDARANDAELRQLFNPVVHGFFRNDQLDGGIDGGTVADPVGVSLETLVFQQIGRSCKGSYPAKGLIVGSA